MKRPRVDRAGRIGKLQTPTEAGNMEKTYSRVTPEMACELRSIVGDGGVIFDDPEKLQPYGFGR